MELSNGVLIHYAAAQQQAAELTVSLTKRQLLGLLVVGQSDGIDMSGDASVLTKLVNLTDAPDPDFAVVTA